MNKKELADHLHNSKYNCAQAVLLAFADEIGEDKEVLFRISEGFGFGAGCGEASAAHSVAHHAGGPEEQRRQTWKRREPKRSNPTRFAQRK